MEKPAACVLGMQAYTHSYTQRHTTTRCPGSFAGHCIWHVATSFPMLHTHTLNTRSPPALPESCLGRQLLLSKEDLSLSFRLSQIAPFMPPVFVSCQPSLLSPLCSHSGLNVSLPTYFTHHHPTENKPTQGTPIFTLHLKGLKDYLTISRIAASLSLSACF